MWLLKINLKTKYFREYQSRTAMKFLRGCLLTNDGYHPNYTY